MNNKDGYSVAPFPQERQLVIDSARLGKRKHSIHGLVEADVTNVRRSLREHRARTGERLSFTAYIFIVSVVPSQRTGLCTLTETGVDSWFCSMMSM